MALDMGEVVKDHHWSHSDDNHHCGGFPRAQWFYSRHVLISGQHSLGFDGDAVLLLIFANISAAGLAGTRWRYDPGFWHQEVGQHGLAMSYVGKHRHISDVGLLDHDGLDLIHWKIHLLLEIRWMDLRLTFTIYSFILAKIQLQSTSNMRGFSQCNLTVCVTLITSQRTNFKINIWFLHLQLTLTKCFLRVA